MSPFEGGINKLDQSLLGGMILDFIQSFNTISNYEQKSYTPLIPLSRGEAWTCPYYTFNH